MTRAVRIAIVMTSVAACGGGGGSTTECGPGTVSEGGTCVPAADVLACGSGTVLEGGACVAVVDVDEPGADLGPAEDVSPSDDVSEPDTVEPTPDSESEPDTSTECVPACDGRECGDDGCGGFCGACEDPERPFCNSVTGLCVSDCVPDCSGAECGDDGCGGSCGDCTTPEKPICMTSLRICVTSCVPTCGLKDCGDDGCGGSCGQCDAGATCGGFDRCVPDSWTCDPFWFKAGDACDCECGAYDPDCDDSEAWQAQCSFSQRCDESGHCVDKAPASWTCSPLVYQAFDACDCACGAPDPDCGNPNLPVLGCGFGDTCSPEGTCEACAPSCDGKACGDDGCGGVCGSCGDTQVCFLGECRDPCAPAPVACEVAECGNDGCGGSCGTCGSTEQCVSGRCEEKPLVPGPLSCVNNCGGAASSGCYCTPGCKAAGDCCADYASVCKACEPDCAGKACGDDGCGGSCGTCQAPTPYCTSAQQCTDECTPQCDGRSCGADGCGGTCGTCDPDATCSFDGQCVPTAWYCPKAYFGDGVVCDCGCGAVDPDCDAGGLLTFGCPSYGTTCGATGLCEITPCLSTSECGGGLWCTGRYAIGGASFAGTCELPVASAKPPGQPCQADEECATSVCLSGRCRTWCGSDGECQPFERCLALPVESQVSTQTVGFGAVCEAVNGTASPCAAQSECTTVGETCQAFVDAATLEPRFLCAQGTIGAGASCAGKSCPTGQECATIGSKSTCVSPCPGGADDCTAGATCGATSFHNRGTSDPSDDPAVPVCLP
jgi:hypothetical protein